MMTFKLDELPEHVQRSVLDTWRENDCFPWGEEWKDSLNGFARIAPIDVKRWEVCGWGRSYIDFSMDTRGHWTSTKGESEDWADEMTGLRLWKYLRRTFGRILHKDCPFTGYCGDEDILKPIRDAIKGHPSLLVRTTLRDVMRSCLEAWVEGYEKDLEHWYSDECIREDIEANEHRFDEEGQLV